MHRTPIPSRFLAAAAATTMLFAGPLLAASAARQIAELTPVVTLPTGKSSSWVEVTKESVWVASESPNVVHRIDPRSNKEVATVALPGNACAGLTSGFGHLWVPLCGTAPSLAAVDLKTNRISSVLKLGPPRPEGGIAASKDSLWIVTDEKGALVRIDPASESVRQTVQVPPESYNPIYFQNRIWVTHPKGSEVTVVDARDGRIVATVRTGAGPRFLTSDAVSVWTLNGGDNTVSQIDGKSLKVVKSIPLNVEARGGDIKSGQGFVWVTLQKTPLTVIDARKAELVCQWTGTGGDSMGLGPNAVWLSNVREATVARYDVTQSLARCRSH